MPNVEGSEIPQDLNFFFSISQSERRAQSSRTHRGLFKKGLIIHGWQRSVTVSAQGGQLRKEKNLQGCVWKHWQLPQSHSLFNSLHPPLFFNPRGIKQAGMITRNPLSAFCSTLRAWASIGAKALYLTQPWRGRTNLCYLTSYLTTILADKCHSFTCRDRGVLY